jgi:hypothetical protein
MQTRFFPASPGPCLQLARLSKREGKTAEASEWLRIAVQRGGEAVRRALGADAELRELAAPLLAPADDGKATDGR